MTGAVGHKERRRTTTRRHCRPCTPSSLSTSRKKAYGSYSRQSVAHVRTYSGQDGLVLYNYVPETRSFSRFTLNVDRSRYGWAHAKSDHDIVAIYICERRDYFSLSTPQKSVSRDYHPDGPTGREISVCGALVILNVCPEPVLANDRVFFHTNIRSKRLKGTLLVRIVRVQDGSSSTPASSRWHRTRRCWMRCEGRLSTWI
jgi:hypothetical protein